MTHTRRAGLTLIEVVAATVLLSMLAAAGVSTLRHVRASLSHQPDTSLVFDLAAFADGITARPELFGITQALHELPRDADLRIAWPDGDEPARRPLRLTAVTLRLSASDSDDYAWLMVESSGSSIARLVPLPPTRRARNSGGGGRP